MLLTRGADPNQVARHGFTPLIQAIINGYLDLAAVLLGEGCNVEQPDIQGDRPLVWAVVLNDLAMVNFLFSYHAKINPSARKEAERSPLVWAVMRRAVEMVQLLLCHGASIGQTTQCSQAPLMWAVIHRNTSVAELLLQYGALPNEPGFSGETALVWALLNNREMVQLLLKYKACPEVMKRDEWFALPLPAMPDRISLTGRSIKVSGNLQDGILF
ncbi:ankyrin repeat-containing domain protein [Penicillium brevicompactum]|uniref:ankyrin repeat-containing domain protein n=1 Tax=Penicillium brevicompactum TaxID=5074 RepID=UPI002540B098|nr:ankyrin repeat-containing domain protein [Penicillium brevicompactum]KAJ5335717.1 ankyrin repeat-containing domain protein [Penicillium brevicompactum]